MLHDHTNMDAVLVMWATNAATHTTFGEMEKKKRRQEEEEEEGKKSEANKEKKYEEEKKLHLVRNY